MGDELGEALGDNLDEAMDALANEPSGNWIKKGMQFLDRKVLGWLAKVRGKPAATIHFHDAKTRYAKWKRIFDSLEDYQKFTFYTMLIWGIYETTSWLGTYVIPKWGGFFPEQAAFRQRQHNDNMEAASWLCKTANDYGRMDQLEDAIGLFRVAITEAEEHLDDNALEFKTSNVYDGFVTAIGIAKDQLAMAEGWLTGGVDTGMLKCISNEDFFYVEIDGYPAGFSYAGKSLLLETITVGNRRVRIYKEGYGDCSKVIEITTGVPAEFDCQMDDSCVLPVPTIDAPADGVVKQGLQFSGTATSESLITWWDWDFGDGSDSKQQNPSHMYWNPGAYLVQLTVSDECGKATAEHTIIISGEGTIPGEPTPTETPTDDLPSGTATVNVKRPVSSKTGRDIVWPIDCFIHINRQYSGDTAPQPFSFGGWKELPIGKHTFKIIAEGYQDESVEIDLKIGDEIDWAPYMDPVGYTPPTGEPPVTEPPVTEPLVTEPPASGEYAIEFLIPSGATMTLTPKTTVPHITVRSTFTDNMRRLSER
jgi:PKD repeat protein